MATNKDQAARTNEQAIGTAMIERPISQAIAAGEACTKAFLEIQEEVLRFTNARLQADVEAQKSLSGCDNVAEAMQVQRDWFAAASRDYLEEAGKLLSIAGRATQSGLAQWQGQTGQKA